jgi:hypothetical protein
MHEPRILDVLRTGFVLILAVIASISSENVQGQNHELPPDEERATTGQDCLLVESRGFKPGPVAPLWAYEVIGADLSRRVIEQEKDTLTTPVGIMDSSISPRMAKGPFSPAVRAKIDKGWFKHIDPEGDVDSHGALAINCLFANGIYGVAAKAEIVGIAPSGYDNSPEYIEASHDIFSCGEPKIINFSSDSKGSQFAFPFLESISKKAILVHSAGNQYDGFRASIDRNQTRLNVISVGALYPNGLTTNYSQDGTGVVVTAPGEEIKVDDGKGGYRNFGGTSGAAPLVAGALANVFSILGSLTVDEARLLLKNTAIPTPNSNQKPSKNGAGTLNALKMVEVARRLKQLHWALMNPAEKENILKDVSLYDFTQLTKEEKSQDDDPVGQDPLSPETCLRLGRTLLANDKCEAKQRGFRLIRRALLLASSTNSPGAKTILSDSARLIAEVYKARGFSITAQFYENLVDEENLIRNLRKGLTSRNKDEASAAARNAIFLGPKGRILIQEALQSPAIKNKDKFTLMIARGFSEPDPSELPLLKQTFDVVKDPRARKEIFLTLVKTDAKGKDLLDSYSKDGDSDKRALAAYGLSGIKPDEESFNRLIVLSNDNVETVRGAAIESAGHFGKLAVPLLREKSRDASVTVRSSVIDPSAQIGDEALPGLLELVRQNDDLFSKRILIRALENLSDESSFRILLSVLETKSISNKDVAREGFSAAYRHWSGDHSLKSLGKKGKDLIDLFLKEYKPGPYVQEIARQMRADIDK